MEEGWKAEQYASKYTERSLEPLSNARLQAAVLALAVVFVYWSSLEVPFYFDDFSSIAENPAAQDPTDLGTLWSYSRTRFFGYLTFALNYALHDTQVTGYHIVNAAIHYLAGCALLGLLTALVRSPVVAAQRRDWLGLVPLLAALIFVLHPLQTQAVTYIVQRLASLSAMLYIASLAFYAWGRLSANSWLYIAALVCAVLAFVTKQNTFTLPAALMLLELIFFQKLSQRQRWIVFFAAIISLGAVVGAFQWDALDKLTRETREISRLDYFTTQVVVLWRYIGLFFYPVNQRLDYDIALETGFTDPVVLVALAGHMVFILLAFWLWSRAPLVSFGILFFYLAHLVESSFIPITDLIYEHRAYLPNLGVVLPVSLGLAWLIGTQPLKYVGILAVGLGLGVAGWLTIERNRLWQDPIAFLQTETRLSPNNERVWTSYGKELMRRGRLKEALPAFGTALNLGRTEDGLEVRPSTLLNAIMALHYTEQYKKAFELERLLPLDALKPVDRSHLHEVRGMTFLKFRRYNKARKEFALALKYFANDNAEAGLAAVDIAEAKPEAAQVRANRVLARNPGNRLARQVIARIVEKAKK